MDTADAVALYGAALSTALALGQGLSAVRRRTKISVSVGLTYSPSGSSYGTPIVVQRGDDLLDETVTIRFTIRNLGGNAVQAIGLLIEGVDKSSQTLHTYQIIPRGLPIVLDPGTTVEVIIQKEHLDLLESCTFLGVVDGTGRRHAVPTKQAASLLRESWRLPTRLDVYQRRDDPAKRVVAFRLADPAQLTNRSTDPRFRGRVRVLAERPRPLIEALMSDEQPRVGAPRPSTGDVKE